MAFRKPILAMNSNVGEGELDKEESTLKKKRDNLVNIPGLSEFSPL